MERKRTYGVWAVRSSTSIFGPAQSWCKENGKPLEFDSKADAENYAKEANEHTTANVRYYVKEKEPEPGAVRKGTSQPELDARSHEEVIPRNDAAEKQNEIPGRQIPSQTDPLVEIRSAVHSNYAGMVAMLGADNRVYLGREERCHYQDMQPSYYDNQDGSLCFVCDQPDMYYFLYQVIREAISDAIDKDAVVESIYGGLHGKADTFFSSDLPYCDVEQATTTFDIDAANKLLDEAGYTDSDGDGIREKDGTKISADFLYQTGSASDDNLAVYICDQAKKIGIELTPNSAVMMDWYAMVQGGQYGLTIFKTQGGFYDPANVVTNINPQTSMDPILMLIGTTKPEMAELVSELDASTDETRIQEIYNTILTTIADENLTTPLVYMHQLAIYSDKVKDYTFPMDSNFTSIQNIKVK